VGSAAPSGAGVLALAAFAIPTANPASAAPFFRKLRRPESFGFTGFSYGMLSRDVTKAAGKVNEMVQEFGAMELTRYSKIKRSVRQSGRPVFSSLAEANLSS
jgi:hypothetical protein